jgi:uncharacterized protein YciI
MFRTLIIIFLSILSFACSNNPQAVEPEVKPVDQYFVFLNSNPNRPELSEDSVQTLQKLHMENIMSMASEGTLVLAGPFEGGGGLFLINAPDTATVWSYLNDDAAIAAGRFVIEMYPFSKNWGSICEVADGATMKTYGFIRFRELMTDVIADNADQRQALGEAGTLLFSGNFESTYAGIMILQSTPDSLLQSIASAHPGVSNGHLSAEIRQLWMSEGVLCDQANESDTAEAAAN